MYLELHSPAHCLLLQHADGSLRKPGVFFNLYIRYIKSTIWNLVRWPQTGLFYSGTVFLSGYVRDWRYQYGQLLQKLEVSPYSIRISLVFISFVVIMYTTSLSTPISSQTLSLNHHLYADVTFMQTSHNSSFPSIHQNFTLISLTCKMLYNRSLPGWLQIFSLSTLLKLNLFLLDLNNNYSLLTKIHDCCLTTTHFARNLGFIFD